ncbi:hypothetical protein BIA58_23610 [Salmonella enterica]|nr:hypothetical protein [Salmonella enterica]EBW8796357.1 hypothetical protein [Salmonella enterica subsp. enterica serovar Oranienburg]ECF7301376.1 hypothetical protein [Salmonella enterica subsp. enterica]EDR7293080.1 hypothetical protein [Salmonella enterica subsp. enterica serovar Pomona]EBQ4602802.1 hypothetical protein [Salmonella enterica]
MTVLSNDGQSWLTKLERIGEKSARNQSIQFSNLGHLIDSDIARGYFKRGTESSKFKYKQRIISLTYVFVPLALKPHHQCQETGNQQTSQQEKEEVNSAPKCS